MTDHLVSLSYGRTPVESDGKIIGLRKDSWNKLRTPQDNSEDPPSHHFYILPSTVLRKDMWVSSNGNTGRLWWLTQILWTWNSPHLAWRWGIMVTGTEMTGWASAVGLGQAATCVTDETRGNTFPRTGEEEPILKRVCTQSPGRVSISGKGT